MTSIPEKTKKRHGSSRHIISDNSGNLTDLVGSPRKLTFRKKEESAQSSEQIALDTVVRAAATLSHEINNPLMAITGAVEILLKNKKMFSEDILEKIEQIDISAERIRQVLARLTDAETLYYRDAPGGKVIDLDKIINQVAVRDEKVG